MVIKLQTIEGQPVHLLIPGYVWATAVTVLLATGGAILTVNQRLAETDIRLEMVEEAYIELTSDYVPRREIEESVFGRLDRIEDKLDRLLETG